MSVGLLGLEGACVLHVGGRDGRVAQRLEGFVIHHVDLVLGVLIGQRFGNAA